MVFDSRVTFEPGTGRAILRADTLAGTSFQVIVDPQYAIDLWGVRRPVDPLKFASAIREHLGEITKAAVSTYADGELVLQLD